MKKAFNENPLFSDSKIVYSIYNDDFTEGLDKGFAKKINMEGIEKSDLKHYEEGNFVNLNKAAIDNADAIIIGSENINKEIEDYLKKSGKPFLEFHPEETYIEAYNKFYDEVMGV